jgi:hypothetical protein
MAQLISTIPQLISTTQQFTVGNTPTLVSSGNLARKAIEIQNLGSGSLYVSFNTPPTINASGILYGGVLILPGDKYLRDINCTTDQIFLISNDPFNGSNAVLIETSLMVRK